MKLRRLVWVLFVALALAPRAAWACAACYGQSDSPLAQGMNWGILSLLAVIVTVLCGVAGFFVCLARRAALLAAGPETRPTLRSSPASTS